MTSNGEKVSKLATAYHDPQSGFHCAEAVAKALVETYGDGTSCGLPQVATAFGGGLGRSKQDICGAVAGATLALGCLYGRKDPGVDWTEVAQLAAELKQRFEKAHGTTNCGELLVAFGPQENMMRCRQLSGEVAALVSDIIEAHGM